MAFFYHFLCTFKTVSSIWIWNHSPHPQILLYELSWKEILRILSGNSQIHNKLLSCLCKSCWVYISFHITTNHLNTNMPSEGHANTYLGAVNHLKDSIWKNSTLQPLQISWRYLGFRILFFKLDMHLLERCSWISYHSQGVGLDDLAGPFQLRFYPNFWTKTHTFFRQVITQIAQDYITSRWCSTTHIVTQNISAYSPIGKYPNTLWQKKKKTLTETRLQGYTKEHSFKIW